MRWSWPGLVATILAVGVAAGLILAIWLIASEPLEEPGQNALSVIVGAMVGAISTYLGITRNGKGDE